MLSLRILVAIVVSCTAGSAFAGGTCDAETDADLRALRRLRDFRRKPKALAPVVDALCHEEYATQVVAITRLRELGPVAVAPLFARALAGTRCPGTLPDEDDPYLEALVEVICALPDVWVDDPYCGRRRVKRDARENQRVINGLLANTKTAGPSRRLVLDLLAEMDPLDCPSATTLRVAVRSDLLALLASEDADLRRAAIGLLADSESGQAAIVTALAELFARVSDDDERHQIVRALGKLAAPARVAMPHVATWLGAHIVTACERGRRTELSEIATALGQIGGVEATTHLSQLLSVWQAQRCPDFPVSSVLTAVADNKGVDAGGETILRRTLISSQEPLSTRMLIARALEAIGARLTERERKVKDALAHKQRLLLGRAKPPQVLPSPEVRSLRDAVHAWRVCEREAGGEPDGSESPPDLTQQPTETLAVLARCLNSELCGPNAAARRQVVERCCAATWPQHPPDWCHP